MEDSKRPSAFDVAMRMCLEQSRLDEISLSAHAEELEAERAAKGMQFFSIDLPSQIPGQLTIASHIPGSYELLKDAFQLIEKQDVKRVISLSTLEEIQRKAPQYTMVMDRETLPWTIELLPVRDFRAPEKENKFIAVAFQSAGHLWDGDHILLHCGGSFGRSAMFAMCVLMVIGSDLEAADKTVTASGIDWIRTGAQYDFLIRVCDKLGK